MMTPLRRSRRVANRRSMLNSRSTRLNQVPAYEYEPFSGSDSIRVLELAPGSGEQDQICCRLFFAQIDQAEDTYEAISYVWGEAEGCEPILCNGKRLFVTANLASGLYSLRDSEKPRLLWADAVCINQRDELEKSAQVRQMDKIFRGAREVLIWLGKDCFGMARNCFDLIQKTNGFLDALLEECSDINKVPHIVASQISSDSLQWKDISFFTKLHWFDRLWVIQEVGVAKKAVLIWGKEQMSYAQICELSLWVASRPDISALISNINTGEICNSYGIAHSTYGFGTTWTNELPYLLSVEQSKRTGLFLAVLDLGRGKLVTLAVDRIYAFLGHPLARKLKIHIDYKKSPEDVYFETACALLEDPVEAPYLLFFAGYDWWEHWPEFGESPRLPSWVPCWDVPWRKYYTMSSPSLWYAAGGNRLFEANVQDDKSVLIRGFIFDEVVWVSDVLHAKNLTMEANSWDRTVRDAGQPLIDTLWNEVQAFVKAYYPSETIASATSISDEAFSLTMVQGYPWDISYKRNPSAHNKLFEIYRRKIREIGKHLGDSHGSSQNVDGVVVEGGFMSASHFVFAASYSDNRRLAITRSRRFALVPKHTKPGHSCCVCPGISKPLILLLREDRRYILVGDAYIHGVMEGEIIQDFIDSKIELEDIIID